MTLIREEGFAVWPFDSPRLPIVLEIYPRILTGAVVKRCETARAKYLEEQWPNLEPALASFAKASEDAFDAAISALIVDAPRDELELASKADGPTAANGPYKNPMFQGHRSAPHPLAPARGSESFLSQQRYNNRVWYEIAADLTAALHLGFLAFVVFGALLGRGNRWWRMAHLVSMAYGVLIEVFYWYCPLTDVEQYLRRRAGGGSYEEPFIAHYINKFIYLDVPQWSLIVAATAVLGVNATLYIRWRRGHRIQ